MSEAELISAAQETWGNYISTMGLFISIISAYLVVAYLAGKELLRSQVILINLLFIIFIGYGMLGMYNWSRVAHEMATLAIEMSEQRKIGPTTLDVPTITLLVQVPIVIACLKFMWDVRHTKSD